MAGEDSYDPEDFPTREQLIRAGLLAAFLAFMGFGISFLLFVKRSVIISIRPIDRRSAEEAPPPAYADRDGSSHLMPFGDGYIASNLSDPEKPNRRPRLAINKPQAAATTLPPPVATPTPQITPTAIPLPDTSKYPDGQPGGHRPPRVTPPQTASATSTNTSPAAPPRPSPKSWGEAWNSSRLAMVQFIGSEGPVAGGVIVDPSGLVVSCASKLSPGTMGRVQLNAGGQSSASVVGYDDANDLVLLKLPPGDYPHVPICPESPAGGEMLLSPVGSDPGQSVFEKCLGSAGGHYLYRGPVQYSSAGAALINTRGELAGVSLGRPYHFPMNSLSLSAQPSVIKGLVDSKGGQRGSRSGDEILATLLSQRVAGVDSREKPSQSNARILPGESVGNYPLGMSRELVERELGKGTVAAEGGGFVCLEFPTPHLTFTFAENRAIAIESDFSFYQTTNGLAPGSDFDRGRIKSILQDAVMAGGLAVGEGLEIESNGSKIERIRVVPR